MKKFLFTTLSLFLIIACSKEQDNSKKQGLFPSIMSRLSGYDLNEEATIVYDHIVASSVSGGLIKDRTFGHLTAVKVNGSFGGHTSVTINGTEYTDGGSSDFLLYQSEDLNFDQYYGENLNVMIANNEVSFHCPEAIQVTPLNDDSIIINGNIPQVIEWNADPNNPLEKIILRYFIYDQVRSDFNSLIKEDVILIDDNGSFDISTLYSDLGEAPKSITIHYYRGNGRKMPFKNSADEYFFFTCVSADYNHYNIVF